MSTTTLILPAKINKRVRTVTVSCETVEDYAFSFGGIQLRPYQLEPIERIFESIENHLGDTIILVFPRQSGKDELLVNLKVFLLDRYAPLPVGIVEVNPTYKPQTITARMRFDRSLKLNQVTKRRWQKHGDFMRQIKMASVSFLSGDDDANTVGATANLLLIVNEAQDISPVTYSQKFEPMTSSTNATRLICGTVWTSKTFLAQEIRAAREAEKRDGRKRVFMADADTVRKYVPWYGNHVDAVVEKLGRQHPLVKTQYFNEEIDEQAGMFNAGRRALMQGDRPGHPSPLPGRIYAFCIDVAGQDEAKLQLEGMGNPGRDSTTLSIIEVDLSTLQTLQLPTYRVVARSSWKGLNHLVVFGKIKALAESWEPQHIVIDATGVGEGLWGLLDRAFPTRVTPIKFSQQMKSEIGWGFLAIIETGRFRDCAPNDEVRQQYDACQSEILPGPLKNLRWGVPDGTRTADGQLIHDDYIMADALVATLDKLAWSFQGPTLIVQGIDPLPGMDTSF